MKNNHFFKINTKIRQKGTILNQKDITYIKKTVRVPMYLIAAFLDKNHYTHDTQMSLEEKTEVISWINSVCEKFVWNEESITTKGASYENYTFNEAVSREIFKSLYYPYGIAYKNKQS